MSGLIERDRPYNSAQVAELLFGRSVQWFYAYRARHGAAEGFPAPVSPTGHPRWSGAALLAWMQRPHRAVRLPSDAIPEPQAASLAGAEIVDIAARLRHRSRVLAFGRFPDARS